MATAPPGVRPSWRLAIEIAAVLSVGFVASLPRTTLARTAPKQAIDPWPRTTPAQEALTAGVLRLQAPGASLVRIPASTTLLGSTELEVHEASARCPQRWGTEDESDALNTCSEAWFSQELPRHTVTLAPYWIDRTEVTVAQYQRCVELRRCSPVPFEEGARRFNRPTLPVSLVRYEDARRYCAFRGGRLPTEAEWEHAARGLARVSYPWGDTFHRHAANHGRMGSDVTSDRDGYPELAPVGSFPAGRTASGVLDLAGNVAEWVGDYFGPYPALPQSNPTGPTGPLSGGTSFRIVRGGDYQSVPSQLRGAARQIADASVRSTAIGFRCVRPTRIDTSGQ